MGEKLGFERISLKNEKLKGQFVSGKEDYFKSETFSKVLKFVQEHPRICKLKDTSGKFTLTIDNIRTVEDALALFNNLST
jgi:transcription-repair coupling factor (superfamily II helicase)